MQETEERINHQGGAFNSAFQDFALSLKWRNQKCMFLHSTQGTWHKLDKSVFFCQEKDWAGAVCSDDRGVLWVNDSKATNVDATYTGVKGVRGRKAVVLLGGLAKVCQMSCILACHLRYSQFCFLCRRTHKWMLGVMSSQFNLFMECEFDASHEELSRTK